MSWGQARRPKISTKLGNPNPREGGDGDIQIKGSALGAKLFGKWSGRWWDIPLSRDGITKFGVTDSDYLSIDRDSVDIIKSGTKVSSFGETVTIGQVASGQSNVLISSGALKLRNNTDDLIILAADGSATISGDVTIGGTSLTTTADNVVIGDTDTGSTLVTHAQTVENVFIGSEAGKTTTYGKYNVFIGYRAGMNWSGVEGSASARFGNIAIGHLAFQGASTSALGNDNIAVGRSALQYYASGTSNTCVGKLAGGGGGSNTITGSYNTLIGHNAGNNSGSGNIESGVSNICISAASGTANTSAVTNAEDTGYAIAIGFATKAGTNCIAIGKGTNINLVTASGDDSIAIGSISDATGAQSIAIGEGAQATATGTVAIGDGAIASATNAAALGKVAIASATYASALGNGIENDAALSVRVGASGVYSSLDCSGIGNSWSTTSDVRVKKDIVDTDLGLDFINALKPVKYVSVNQYDWPEEIRNVGDRERMDDILDMKDGFIAQDVKAAMDKFGVTFDAWSEEKSSLQRLGYSKFVVPLTKAVQELSAKLDAMQTEINNLKAE